MPQFIHRMQRVTDSAGYNENIEERFQELLTVFLTDLDMTAVAQEVEKIKNQNLNQKLMKKLYFSFQVKFLRLHKHQILHLILVMIRLVFLSSFLSLELKCLSL